MAVGLVKDTFISKLRKTAGPSIVFIIAFMVISSPVITLINPAAVVQAAPLSGELSRVDSSSYHSSLSVPEMSASTTAPSTISSTPTIQAALLGPATFRSTDIVNSKAIYEIQFFTTTTGTIDKIDITFPAGTIVGAAGVIERVGITGPASVTKSGTTVTLDLNTPVSVPAGTFVRLEMVDIFNPPAAASNYMISVTTRDPANVPIDGPSLSPAYTIKQIGTNDIADNAVTTPKIADEAITSTKPAESFMKRVFVTDTEAGHDVGWDPNGVTSFFTITDPAVSSVTTAFVSFSIGATIVTNCEGANPGVGQFTFSCEFPPSNNAELQYVVTNLPANVISDP